jgi:hypothetical protein
MPRRRDRWVLLSSEGASISTLWIVLGVIGAIVIGMAMYGISRDDQTVGAPSAATTGQVPPDR